MITHSTLESLARNTLLLGVEEGPRLAAGSGLALVTAATVNDIAT